MIAIRPHIIPVETNEDQTKKIEWAGRTCYKSEGKMKGEDERNKFIRKIIKSGHHSVIEHSSYTIKFVVDRGISHEIVRHRLAAFSQESSRYCNYNKDKFGNNATYIIPCWLEDIKEDKYELDHIGIPIIPNKSDLKEDSIMWIEGMMENERQYMAAIEKGWKAEEARCFLNNSLKTELVMTANFREWRHVFNLRCSKPAHPQIREIMMVALEHMHEEYPVIFEDIYNKYFDIENN